MADRPIFENSPGLTLRRVGTQWEARWRPRTDLVERGYPPTPQRLWKGAEPTDKDRQWVSGRCNAMQAEMLAWGRGATLPMNVFDGTLRSLFRCYETDPDSTIHKLRYQSRLHSARLCRMLVEEHGDVLVNEIKARQLKHWHEEWKKRGVAIAHALIGKLRTVIRFGATFIEDDDCIRLMGILSGMRFQMPQPRRERLTAEQAIAIRRMAHATGRHSIALAQALSFELMLRQKDVIGEWIPHSEPGVSDVVGRRAKWMIGLRWSEITENGILTHTTSKRGKEVVIDLKLAPMVMEEFAELAEIPRSGPVIINEQTGRPYTDNQFRVHWRECADLAGVPKSVFNMDSRAGAISEASDAGAPLEHIRHAATHSDTAMTQKYSRGTEEKIAEVQRRRAEHRNKKRTPTVEN